MLNAGKQPTAFAKAQQHHYQLEALQSGICLLGLPQYGKHDLALAPAAIRQAFYALEIEHMELHDLGDLAAPADQQLHAFQEVICQLLENRIEVVVLGGDQHSITCLGQALCLSKKLPTLSVAQPHLNEALPFVQLALLGKEGLFHYQHIGSQAHVSNASFTQKLRAAGASIIRYGELADEEKVVEPLLRETQAFHLSANLMAMQDAPAVLQPQPFGLNARQACQLAWYAGFSPFCQVLQLGQFYPGLDDRQQTATAMATALWYYAEAKHKPSLPNGIDLSAMKQYDVPLLVGDDYLSFFTQPTHDIWFMQVPCPVGSPLPYIMQPCTEEDYQQAQAGELPDSYFSVSTRIDNFFS